MMCVIFILHCLTQKPRMDGWMVIKTIKMKIWFGLEGYVRQTAATDYHFYSEGGVYAW